MEGEVGVERTGVKHGVQGWRVMWGGETYPYKDTDRVGHGFLTSGMITIFTLNIDATGVSVKIVIILVLTHKGWVSKLY